MTFPPSLDEALAALPDTGDPLVRLDAAVEARGYLAHLGEELLDKVVADARAAGSSWADIGSRLGVTRQAAHQRHGGRHRRGDSHLTPRAARIVSVHAPAAARALRHNFIGTEHLLLGLLEEADGIGARILADAGVRPVDVARRVEELIGQGSTVVTGELPMTPRARRAMRAAFRDGLQLGHNYLGTEHILLGLARIEHGVAARVLGEHGLDHDELRVRVVTTLTGLASGA